jgi:endonuclease YncB( thermonuclease family)
MIDLKEHGYHTPLHALKGLDCECRIVDVYDGDSLQVVLDDRGLAVKVHCRISGIDTCELRSKSDEALTFAHEARTRLISLVTGKPVEYFKDMSRAEFRGVLDETTYTARCVCGVDDKYGRTLAKIYLHSQDKSIGNILICEGLAVEYNGGTKMSEENMVYDMRQRRSTCDGERTPIYQD